MKKPIDSKHWYFVDETGDPVFYDKHGNLIVGKEGCSPILGLGFIETDNPNLLRKALANLHNQIAKDKYLQSIPSIQKTNRAFHAKDDAPEIRYLVYQLLLIISSQPLYPGRVVSIFGDVCFSKCC